MRYFLSTFILLVSSVVFSQTPSLYDTWRTSAPLYNAVIKISPDKVEIIDAKNYDSSPSSLLPSSKELDSSHVIRANPRAKIIDILKVIYDSAQAKGRIFFQRGKYSGIACLKFCLFDNGTVILGGTIKGNGTFTTLQEAEAASIGNSSPYEYPMLNSSKRIAMFALMKDPAAMTQTDALNMIAAFGKRVENMIKGYYASSPSEQKRFISSVNSKLPIETAVGQMLIADIFIENGYD